MKPDSIQTMLPCSSRKARLVPPRPAWASVCRSPACWSRRMGGSSRGNSEGRSNGSRFVVELSRQSRPPPLRVARARALRLTGHGRPSQVAGGVGAALNAGFNIVKERATILCCRHGKILLVDRGRSRWALPGGAIRRKEAPGDAALRELLEETSLVVSNVQYVFQFVGLNKRHHVFLSVLGDDLQARPANGIVRCCWIRPDEIVRFAASVPTREIVALLLGAGGLANGAARAASPTETPHRVRQTAYKNRAEG